MTIEQLRKLLNSYPDNMPVLIQGYEYGYDNFEICTDNVIIKLNAQHYEGLFRKVDNNETGLTALIIYRRHHD